MEMKLKVSVMTSDQTLVHDVMLDVTTALGKIYGDENVVVGVGGEEASSDRERTPLDRQEVRAAVMEAVTYGRSRSPQHSAEQIADMVVDKLKTSDEQEKLRIRVEVTQWVELEIGAEYFGYECGETPDELWKSTVSMYDADPGMAWAVTDEGNWQVKVKRVGTESFLHKAHLQPGELLPGRDDDE